MITNINYNDQFNLEVVSKLHDKLDKLEKENASCKSGECKFCNDYEIYSDRSVVLDIGLLGLLISNNLENAGESLEITMAIRVIERILETGLYNIDDSEINKDYMVELLHKLKERTLK